MKGYSDTMIKQKFDISKKPLLLYDDNAYLVDSKNVNLHRQYVEKYYDLHELHWFDDMVMKPIRENKYDTVMLCYRETVITHDYRPGTSCANNIYYITNALMTVE